MSSLRVLTCPSRALPARTVWQLSLRQHRLAFPHVFPARCGCSADTVQRRSASSLSNTITTSAAATDEDMLIRMLVQDAFHPLETPTAQREPVPDPIEAEAPTASEEFERGNDDKDSGVSSPESAAAAEPSKASTQLPPLSEEDGGVELSSSSSPSHAQLLRANTADDKKSSITKVRSLHGDAEAFAVVRQRQSASAASLGTAEDLEWLCLQCQSYNSVAGQRDGCGTCAAPAATSERHAQPPVRHVALMPAEWLCTHCAHVNNSAASAPEVHAPSTSLSEEKKVDFLRQREKFVCSTCAHPFEGVQPWTCPACEHFCPRAATQCPTCLSARPVRWTCSACKDEHNGVFASRCRSCNAGRATRFSDAVVRCACCGDWNDVRWELCATCMAPTEAMTARMPNGEKSSGESSIVAVNAASTILESLPGALSRDAQGRLHSHTVLPLRARSTEGVKGSSSGDATLSSSSAPRSSLLAVQRTRAPAALLDGVWWCSKCNVLQRRNASFCDICLTSREQMKGQQLNEQRKRESDARAGKDGDAAWESGAVPVSVSFLPATADGDWRCPYCSSLHPVEQRTCCGHRREVPPGYWLCEQCCSTNRNDRALCLGCGQAQERVSAWTCAVCAFQNAADAVVCGQCGIPPKAVATTTSLDADSPARVAACTSEDCPVCGAPNLSSRMACYRCRARLHDAEWTCNVCGAGNPDRNATRCAHCAAVHAFDLREEVWLCEVCFTAVHSGGELPVRARCPKCHAARSPSATHFPSRWKCACGMFNRAWTVNCGECGARRHMASLHTHTSCPHCFGDTVLDVNETCTRCGGSLEACLELVANPVSADIPRTNAHAQDDRAGSSNGVDEADDEDAVAAETGLAESER